MDATTHHRAHFSQVMDAIAWVKADITYNRFSRSRVMPAIQWVMPPLACNLGFLYNTMKHKIYQIFCNVIKVWLYLRTFTQKSNLWLYPVMLYWPLIWSYFPVSIQLVCFFFHIHYTFSTWHHLINFFVHLPWEIVP